MLPQGGLDVDGRPREARVDALNELREVDQTPARRVQPVRRGPNIILILLLIIQIIGTNNLPEVTLSIPLLTIIVSNSNMVID